MDCIACDRCRLNGKVQMRGMANVLKSLFLPENMKEQFFKDFNQQDVISVIQLLAKLSESIQIVNYYTFWALRA